MKKKIFRKLLVLAMLPVLVFTVFLTACGTKETESETPKYTVTVIGGTGGGEYEENADCTVTASIPEGQSFIGWEIGGEIVSAQNPYTFKVTASVTVTAQFESETAGLQEVSLQKSTGGNPIGGFGVGDSSYDSSWDTESTLWQKGDKEILTYAGDPSVLVESGEEGETVYLYAGHDVSKTGEYNMPEWICYSSTDLLSWKAESIIMDIRDVPWTNKSYNSAWAAQVVKYEGYYWFLFCCWSDTTAGSVTANENGDQCIGVAVSKDPTGPFTCYSQPLVYSSWTDNRDDATKDIARWNDIDPTALIYDTDKDGKEEFYIAWGNSNCFMAQVEITDATKEYCAEGYTVALEIVDQSASGREDINVIDRKTQSPCYGGETSYKDSSDPADWDIMRLDCYSKNPVGNTFTEAPYLYERNGKFYMFYAAGWREALAYSVNDTLWESVWDYGNLLMDPTATSNTNHPAIFDFGGSTYMIYHNGSLPYGSGYRRVACIAELEFDENGYIKYVAETSTGLTGVASKITDSNGTPLSHRNFKNPQQDSGSAYLYPLKIDLLLWQESDLDDTDDMLWEIEEAKYVPDGKNGEAYVSIQAYNKPGLYIWADPISGEIVITQDSEDPASKEGMADKINMTFRTLVGENGEGVQFQSIANSEYYLASVNGVLVITKGATKAQRTFFIETETSNRSGDFRENNGLLLS